MCKVSVVIPVYGVEAYITHTMQSLQNQTFRDFEIILVDDGSPDQSIAVAKAALENSDLTYRILTQENSGQGVARNTGVAAAKGEWIYFLDSDDVIQPQTLERMLELTEEYPAADIVYTDYQYVYEDVFRKEPVAEEKVTAFTREEMLEGFLLRKKVVLVPGTLYRKSFLEDNNIRHIGIRWSEDQLFMWNVLSYVKQVVHTSRVLYNYFRHPGSTMSATPTGRVVDAYAVWKETMPRLGDENTKRFALARWVLGCIRVYAQRSNYAQWKGLAESLEVTKHMEVLLRFPSWPVRVFALAGVANKRLLYWLCSVGKTK